MGLIFKPWTAPETVHEGSMETKSGVRSPQEEHENVSSLFCSEDSIVSTEYMIGSSSHRELSEDVEQSGRLTGPDFLHSDDSPPSDNSSFFIHRHPDRHPLLGPFHNFPGTQFWEVFWHTKKMIKWRHEQLLTKNMSSRNFQRCLMDLSNQHLFLLQSIEDQMRDGIVQGPLLHMLLKDQVRLLNASKLAVQYFRIIRMPLVSI